MIYPLIEFVLLVLVTGALYGIVNPIVLGILNSQVALYPSAFNSQQVAFAKAVLNYLLFFIIIGGIIGLWVWVNRTKSRGTVFG